ncbi:hypothetical protein GJ496_009243 [Pomphorhynchus laevis]|nr:hypothetical protein GJ496_009243 [Pomphorhynchus laevis]
MSFVRTIEDVHNSAALALGEVIERFVFSTPFTKNGSPRGELQDQYQRKTVLTVERALPYITSRVAVIRKEYIILTPIEAAIEDMKVQIDRLSAAIREDPPDAKMLQMVLEGCIRTTVNQGPLEIAIQFLGDQSTNNLNCRNRFHYTLCSLFKQLIYVCGIALNLNQKLIGPDQKEYQHELEKNYVNFSSSIAPLIDNL